VEEHFLAESFDHLDPGLDHHEGRSHRQAKVDAEPYLRLGARCAKG
jgi:hypothetical protein